MEVMVPSQSHLWGNVGPRLFLCFLWSVLCARDKRRWTAPNNWQGIAPNSTHVLRQPFLLLVRLMTILVMRSCEEVESERWQWSVVLLFWIEYIYIRDVGWSGFAKLKFKSCILFGGRMRGNKAGVRPHPIPEIPYCGMLDQDMGGGGGYFQPEIWLNPFIKIMTGLSVNVLSGKQLVTCIPIMNIIPALERKIL